MIYALMITLLTAFLLIIFKYYTYAAALLGLGILITLFSNRANKSAKVNKSDEENNIVLTSTALRKHPISVLIQSRSITGNFLVSKSFIDSMIKSAGDSGLPSDYALMNIEFLKRNMILKEINCEDNITSYFKYAFDNNHMLIFSEEKASENLLKIFKVKSINLGILLADNKQYKKGEYVHYVVIKNQQNEVQGVITENVHVFLKSSRAVHGNIYRGRIENVLQIKDKTELILEDDNEN